jgi:hypothetical protein
MPPGERITEVPIEAMYPPKLRQNLLTVRSGAIEGPAVTTYTLAVIIDAWS